MIPDILDRLSQLIELDYVYDMAAYDVLWWLISLNVHGIQKRSKVFSYWRGSHVITIHVHNTDYDIVYAKRDVKWIQS